MSKADESKVPKYIREGDGFADITLATPITVDGAKMSILRMREPTVRDIEASQDSRANAATTEISLFANLCTLTPDQVRDLKARNYFRLQVAFSLFTN